MLALKGRDNYSVGCPKSVPPHLIPTLTLTTSRRRFAGPTNGLMGGCVHSGEWFAAHEGHCLWQNLQAILLFALSP